MKIFKSLIGMVAKVLSLATMALSENVQPTGRIRWNLVDANGSIYAPDGTLYGQGHVHNMVVTAGKAYCAERFIANTTTAVSHVAIGTGNTAPALGQTALVGETARVALTTKTTLVNVATLIGTIPAGTGTGQVEEVALFNAGAGPTMIARALTGTITKPAGLGLQFTWDVTHG